MEIKDTDFRLQEGIQDTRNKLINHLQGEQISQLPITTRQVSNNKYPGPIVPHTTKSQYDGQRIIFNNFHTPVANQNHADLKNLQFRKPAANFIA